MISCRATETENTTQKKSDINKIKRGYLRVKTFTLTLLITALYEPQCKLTLKTTFSAAVYFYLTKTYLKC